MLLWKVSSLLLLCLSAAADQQETTVKPGDNANLQCHFPSDAAVMQLEWVRLEQKSDGYVFFYRNNRSYKDYQDPSFHGRVELRDPEMKDGDVSVILKNVTVNDAGTYKCKIISSITENGERIYFSSIVSLTVTDSVHSAPLMLAEGNEDEGDNGGGNEDERVKDEGDNGGGNEEEGNTDGGNEDGRKNPSVVLVALLTAAVMSLIITAAVVFIRYKSINKQTYVQTEKT